MKSFWIATLLTLMISASAQAASEADLMLGVGMGKSVLDQQGNFERLGTLGVRYGSVWKIQANGGYWYAPALGDRSSLYGSLQGGVEVVGEGGMFAQVMFGPGIIQHPDDKLAGHFQFHLSTGAGIKSEQGYTLALVWNHLSNAGILQPNLGRDLLTLQVGIPLWRSQ